MLVVQSDAFNRSLIQTVVVVPFSTNSALARASGNVLCRARQTGLEKASVANVSQISVIDRARLAQKVGILARPLLDQVEEGVRLVLAL